MPSLSIATLSYNQGEYLPDCVQSVLSSRIRDLQYLVMDPGSSDSSRAYLDSIVDPRLHKRFERDDGPAHGLNNALRYTTGEVFGYINADDRYLPGTLEYVASYFEANAAVDVLLGGIRIIDDTGKARRRKRAASAFTLESVFADTWEVYQPATFIRTAAAKAAGGFNTANRTCWDFELLVDLALKGARFASSSVVLADFRIHSGSVTGSGRLHQRNAEECSRIREKITAATSLRRRRFAGLGAIWFKLNPLRQLRYFSIKAVGER